MTAVRDVLDAIKRFEDQHGEDEQFRDVFSALADAESALEKAAPVEPSPGQRAATQSAERAAARAARRPKVEPRKAAEEKPKSLADARERAKERLTQSKQAREEPEGEPAEAEPAAA